MNPEVKKQFDEAAKDYDRQRRQLIPRFDDFYGTGADLAEAPHDEPEILDLGAGTGLFSSYLLKKYPMARLTLMDMSETMLETARDRFRHVAHVRYVVEDYSSSPLGGPYDIVISSLSIHHLTHPKKRELFRTVFESLRNGGIFVNADQAQGETPEADALYKTYWERSIQKSGLSPEDIKAAKKRRMLDINATTTEQIRWIREAGFAEADCVYKHYDFAVFFGKKPV